MPCPVQPADGASVQHWREGAIARIHFNRPEALNAIDRAVAARVAGTTFGGVWAEHVCASASNVQPLADAALVAEVARRNVPTRSGQLFSIEINRLR